MKHEIEYIHIDMLIIPSEVSIGFQFERIYFLW